MILSQLSPYFRQQMLYVKQFIKSPRAFGSLVPSSRWLCQKMIEQADWQNVTSIAELGAGSGVLTRHLLDRLPAHVTLDAFEIEPELIKQLNDIANYNNKLTVRPCSAEKLDKQYDLIFSCLPLLSIPIMPRLRILKMIQQHLTPNTGVYIQFQYSPLSEKLLSHYFSWTRVYEIRNMPPAWVYTCKALKKNDGAR